MTTEQPKELKLSNIKLMTEEQLEHAIVDCFEYAPDASPIDRLAVLQEADFYRRELDRRHDDKVELRSLLLEIAVIGLILAGGPGFESAARRAGAPRFGF